MLTKTSPWIAGAAVLLLSLTAVPAEAATFSFKATASTVGFPDAYTDTPPVVDGATSNSASSYPPGAQYNNGYGLVYAEATASSHSRPGHASAASYAYAHRISATAFRTTNVYGSGRGSFTDYLTVESSTLPVGTEVTLRFRAATAIGKFSNENNYNGNVRVDLQVGSSAGYATWNTSTGVEDLPVQSPEITVKTRVGSRLYFTGKVYAYTSASFYSSSTRSFDGKLGLQAEMNVERIDAEWDVTVRSDSGKIFQPMP